MSSHPQILIVSGVQGDTRRYRAFHLREQFRLAGIDARFEHITSAALAPSSRSAQVLILQRVSWDSRVEELLRTARRNRAVVLTDIDDLVFIPDSMRWIDSPDFHDPVRASLYRDMLERNQKTLQHSDGVIASTEYLAEQARACGKPVWVHRNGFSLEMLSLSRRAIQAKNRAEEAVIIGYASGTPTHDRDFALVQPVLRQLLNRHPRTHLYIAGHLNPGSDWGNAASRVKKIPFIEWRRLPQVLAGFSINLAPLRQDNPFSQSKSEIKFMEAALVGVATIASPTDAFRSAIRDGQTGFLASTPDQWEDTLTHLIEQPNARDEIAAAALQQVIEQYSPGQRAVQAAGLVNAVLDHFQLPLPRLPNPPRLEEADPDAFQHLWTTPAYERHPTLVERGRYTLRVRGAAALAREMWVYFRRLAAPVFPFRNTSGEG